MRLTGIVSVVLVLLPCTQATIPVCNATTCGQQPVGAYPCPDGKHVAHVGPCEYNTTSKKCGYTFINCPATNVCTAATCGKKPIGAYLCPDGKSVASVGPCEYNSTSKKCGYTFTKCPTTGTNVCTPAKCGTKPVGAYLCPDHKTVASVGPCQYNSTSKKCGYTFTKCPPATPDCSAAGACGPPFTGAYPCPDGVNLAHVGPCAYNTASKKCAYTFIGCPNDVCNATSCGPKPLGAYLCPNKKTVAGPGNCTYNKATKKCAWNYIKCPNSTKLRG